MKTNKKPKSLIAKIARKYRVTPRTVRNWRAEGAPLSDPVKLSVWLANRKQVPHGAPPTKTAAAPQNNGPLETGAAAALKRMEQAEAAAYGRLESALANNDAVEIRVAREAWLKLADGLRKYEAAVDEAKRERGELVPRAEVEKHLGNLATLLHQSSRIAAHSLAPALAGETDIVRSRIIIRRMGFGTAAIATAFMRMLKVPDWIVAPFAEDLIKTTTITQEYLDWYFKILQEAVAAEAELNLKVEPHIPPHPEPSSNPPAAPTTPTPPAAPSTPSTQEPQ